MNRSTSSSRRRLAALAAALLLAGCASLDATAPPPASATPAAAEWQAPLPDSDPGAELRDWWQQFHDPLLTRASSTPRKPPAHARRCTRTHRAGARGARGQPARSTHAHAQRQRQRHARQARPRHTGGHLAGREPAGRLGDRPVRRQPRRPRCGASPSGRCAGHGTTRASRWPPRTASAPTSRCAPARPSSRRANSTPPRAPRPRA